MKEGIGKLDFVKMKNFCSLEDTVKREKEKPQTAKIVENIYGKGLLFKIDLLKANNRKTNNPI